MREKLDFAGMEEKVGDWERLKSKGRCSNIDVSYPSGCKYQCNEPSGFLYQDFF